MIGRGGKDQRPCGAAPTTPQAAPWPRQQEDEAKHQNQTFLLLFFLSSKLRDDSEAKSSSHSTTDLVAHEKM